ncbi:MAG: VWA domain-containing protein [Phycisphaerales bacterium]|nr:MAG: VWA domain-containing protein [Phycisphaerales bacterium]
MTVVGFRSSIGTWGCAIGLIGLTLCWPAITPVSPAVALADEPAAAETPPDQPENDGSTETDSQETPSTGRTLEDAPTLERQVLTELESAPHWPARALAAIRLERFDCAPTRDRLIEFVQHDPDWRVRANAIRSLAERSIEQGEGWFEEEAEPRVIRTALRYGYEVDAGRVHRGVRFLLRSNRLDERLLGAEIAAASGKDDLVADATDTVRSVILRMDRAQAGLLSPRLSAMTGVRGLFSRQDWMRWFRENGRRVELAETRRDPPNPHPPPAGERSFLAELNVDAFARFESYVQQWPELRIDLVFALDCTGSMTPVFSRTQSIISDTMLFLQDITESPRFGLVAFRDVDQEFVTRPFRLTQDAEEIMLQTWLQEAVHGGRQSESVLAALHDSYAMSWREHVERLVILIGDGPPHRGEGGACIRLAERARTRGGIRTQVVEPINAPVRDFKEIAEAGGGRLWTLDDYVLILAELLGLERSDDIDQAFMAFIRHYTELLR